MSIVNNSTTHSQIDQLINGSIRYNDHDELLFKLIAEIANGVEKIQLRSDLDQLKDPSVPEERRVTAKQRLLSFIRLASSFSGKVIEKTAVSELSKYIQEMMQSGL